MKWLRRFIVILVVVDFLTPAHFGMFQADSLAAQSTVPPIPLFSGPQDISQFQATVNTLIIEINAILTPLVPAPASGTTSVNMISLTGGVTGSPAIIGLQATADTNASIQINPNGTGNVVLFGKVGDTGVLQIANNTGWYPAKGAGVVACPGGGAGTNVNGNLAAGLLQAGNQTIAGYEVHEDWLARPYWVPGCR